MLHWKGVQASVVAYFPTAVTYNRKMLIKLVPDRQRVPQKVRKASSSISFAPVDSVINHFTTVIYVSVKQASLFTNILLKEGSDNYHIITVRSNFASG
jgi:hypothetical protein